MHPSIDAKRAEIAAICHALGVRRLEVFGSAARGSDFEPRSSDADFLVEFGPDDSMERYLDLQDSLSELLGRQIDLVDRSAILRSRNYIRRRQVLAEAQVVYAA
jgi:predicted nucleotidyltransferase